MRGGYRCLNPGSVSIPKNGSGHSYMIMDDAGSIEWKELD
jgi:predicted phosphodiesterase